MKTKIAIIGGGNMGEAIFAGIHKKFTVQIAEKDAKRRQYLRRRYHSVTQDVDEVVSRSQVIILAVKPQDMERVLTKLVSIVRKDQLIVSIAAGITTKYFEKILGKQSRIVRTMPNMPALIGQGVTAICGGRWAKKNDLSLARKIFDCVGETLVVEEHLMDSITAVSGSGPAYVFLFVECLINSARSLGLKEAQARQLVESTFSGSLDLLQKQKSSAAHLRAKVTSRRGTTEAAINAFTKAKIEKIFTQAVRAAKKRAKELAK